MLKGLLNKNSILKRAFAAKPIPKSPSVPKTTLPETQHPSPLQIIPQTETLKLDPTNFTTGCGNLYEFLNFGGKIEDLVDMEYKHYPSNIKHNDPHSEDYVESEYIEQSMKSAVEDYNRVINDIKRDIKLSEEYQAAIQEIERRPLDHLEKGNTTNVYPKIKDYSEPRSHPDNDPLSEFSKTLTLLDNLKMSINNTPFLSKFNKTSNMVAWQKELDERPVTNNFNHGKGHKYDVETPLNERVVHVADRLGHPEIFPTPFETLLRLERPLSHPGYLDQPFIQIPSAEPDKDINFKGGEVLYENPHIKEWNHFFILNFLVGSVYFAVWTPFCAIIKSSTPSPRVRDEVMAPFYDQNYYNFDVYQLSPVAYGAAVYFFLAGGLVS